MMRAPRPFSCELPVVVKDAPAPDRRCWDRPNGGSRRSESASSPYGRVCVDEVRGLRNLTDEYLMIDTHRKSRSVLSSDIAAERGMRYLGFPRTPPSYEDNLAGPVEGTAMKQKRLVLDACQR